MATIVSIGRNIGGEPMSEDAWDDFRASIYAKVADAVGPVVFDGTGEGEYDGRTEESYTVIGAGLADMVGPRRHAAEFIANLGNLARVFGQDAIAVTAADTQFIAPNGTTSYAWEA